MTIKAKKIKKFCLCEGGRATLRPLGRMATAFSMATMISYE